MQNKNPSVGGGGVGSMEIFWNCTINSCKRARNNDIFPAAFNTATVLIHQWHDYLDNAGKFFNCLIQISSVHKEHCIC